MSHIHGRYGCILSRIGIDAETDGILGHRRLSPQKGIMVMAKKKAAKKVAKKKVAAKKVVKKKVAKKKVAAKKCEIGRAHV